MKTSVLAVLISCTIGQCIAAVEGEDWFPSPDAFQWPAHSKVTVGESQTTPVADFTPEQRKSLGNCIDGIEGLDFLSGRKADLNGDGTSELFIYQPAYSGTGGSVYEIVTPEAGCYRSIGSVMGGIVLCEPAKGSKWLRIEAASRNGGGHMTRYLMTFVAKEYEIVRNEDHDYTHQKVTVRPIEPKK